MYRGVGHLPSLEQLWEIKADLVKIKVPWAVYLSTINESSLPYPCFLACKVWRLETALNERSSRVSDMGIRFKEITVQDYDTLLSLIEPSLENPASRHERLTPVFPSREAVAKGDQCA